MQLFIWSPQNYYQPAAINRIQLCTQCYAKNSHISLFEAI